MCHIVHLPSCFDGPVLRDFVNALDIASAAAYVTRLHAA